MGLGLSQKVAKITVITSAVVLLFAGCVTLKTCYDHRVISQAIDKANVTQMQKETRANDKAAEARASDIIRLNELEQERTDDISKVTDSLPDAAELALVCRRLRQAGYDTSSFPSCR